MKCGFEDDEFLSTYFELDNPHIMLGIYMDDDGIKINHMWFDIKLEYLHQLQNLYFSLSGKELEINV